MKNLKHEQLKMLVMEAFDGEIKPENALILKAHLESCAECRTYSDELKKMKSALPEYEPPKALSEKIMNAVIKEDMKEEKIPAFRRFAGFTAAAGAAFALTLLIITTTADKDTVTIADMPAENPVVAAKPAVKTAPVMEAAPVTESVAVKEQSAPVTAKIEAPIIETEKGPSTARVTTIAVNPVDSAKPSYEVNKISQPSDATVAAAKVTPIPPPDNRLLDAEKAIVGNNVVNVSRGERAIIRVKVEQTSTVRIIVYDKRIKPVSLILDEQKEPGVYEAFWYGRNDMNQAVTEGIYFVYVQIGSTVIKKNIVVTK